MMLNFIFSVHNHQPVGNFDHVLEEAYELAYEPFLEKVFENPEVKLSLHNTGFLLDWLVEKRPSYVELLRAMVERGQVEIIGGGYYEPVLAVIPVQDRLGQIRMMTDKVEQHFGVRPRGLWLAERVWDPTLPTTLKEAGIEYVIVDDFHFIRSGFRKEELNGYYVTEDLGSEVRVFPGCERLRYLMPFEPVTSLEEYLRGLTQKAPSDGAVIYADDGEKFGIWPGTHSTVYEEGWLDDFLDKVISSEGWLRSVTFSEYMDSVGPLGSAYLPTTSYMEMGEWALPPEAAGVFASLRETLKGSDEFQDALRFLQGGMWRNFFSKYPEANWMHKRMLLASRTIAEKAGEEGIGSEFSEALTHLYKAQSNDAYWHGVFGGLYLPHLRTSVYEHIIKAERAAGAFRGKGVAISTFDVDSDTHEEVVMRSEGLSLFISPASGGAIVELDSVDNAVNLLNTLSRRREGYHSKLLKASGAAQGGSDLSPGDSTKSIHDMIVTKEEGLSDYLCYDETRRLSLREHLLKEGETLERFSASENEELGSFHLSPFDVELREKAGKKVVKLSRSESILGQVLQVNKELVFTGPSAFSVDYSLSGQGAEAAEGRSTQERKAMLGVEFNLCLPGCDGPACYYEPGFGNGHDSGQGAGRKGERKGGQRSGLGSSAEVRGVKALELVDTYSGVCVSFTLSREALLWSFPVHTVSLSEAGFERNYQGSCIVFLLPIELAVGAVTDFTLKVEVSKK